MATSRTSERELIEPALRILAEPQHRIRGLATADLARRLRPAVVPTAEDLEILPSRKDDRLSQVIRNLISHRTLEKKGLATYRKDPITGVGHYVLTDLGRGTLATLAQELPKSGTFPQTDQPDSREGDSDDEKGS